jgi:glycosyltransferase involved in cell wall biosynthesis
MTSVVIPVYNAKESLLLTLKSVIQNTPTLKELILVDDASLPETQEFINSLVIDPALSIRLTKTQNPYHMWTNASWNMGVSLAHEPYIAVLNSDITVSPHWDNFLIDLLHDYTIACPQEDTGRDIITLDPLIKEVHPGMIKGACFMFKAVDLPRLFPINELLTHWCGDNYLADRAAKLNGVAFSSRATITHGITHSGKLIPPDTYYQTVRKDVETYQALSGRDMRLVIAQLPNVEAIPRNPSRP